MLLYSGCVNLDDQCLHHSGITPLAMASVKEANGRIARYRRGWGVANLTLLTLFVVPAMYIYLSTDRKSKTRETIDVRHV